MFGNTSVQPPSVLALQAPNLHKRRSQELAAQGAQLSRTVPVALGQTHSASQSHSAPWLSYHPNVLFSGKQDKALRFLDPAIGDALEKPMQEILLKRVQGQETPVTTKEFLIALMDSKRYQVQLMRALYEYLKIPPVKFKEVLQGLDVKPDVSFQSAQTIPNGSGTGVATDFTVGDTLPSEPVEKFKPQIDDRLYDLLVNSYNMARQQLQEATERARQAGTELPPQKVIIQPQMLLQQLMMDPERKDPVSQAMLDHTHLRKVDGEIAESLVDQYTQDLSLDSVEGLHPETFGYEPEFVELTNALSRDESKVVVLLGESGVGKTQLIYKLGEKLKTGDVVDELRETGDGLQSYMRRLNIPTDVVPPGKPKKLKTLDWGAISATQSEQGGQQKLRAMLQELRERDDIILVIEHFERLGTRPGEESPFMTNLRNVIETGKIQVIGTCTPDDFDKTVGTHQKALYRQTHKILMEGTGDDLTLQILRKRREAIERSKQVVIPDETLDTVVTKVRSSISGSVYPATPIAVLDAAATAVSTAARGLSTDLATTEEQIAIYRTSLEQGLRKRLEEFRQVVPQLETAFTQAKEEFAHGVTSSIQPSDVGLAANQLEKAAQVVLDHALNGGQTGLPEQYQALRQAIREKIPVLFKNAIDTGRALTLKRRQIVETEDKIRTTQAQLDALVNREQKPTKAKGIVTPSDIFEVISQISNVPKSKLEEDDFDKLETMEPQLRKRVIGQEEAINAVVNAMQNHALNFKDPRRPIGSFLFLGPPGVGKTELAKALAELQFGTEDALIRIDMSEYREAHTVSRLIGSPPGYVGYDEGGQLTNAVRKRPFSVILLDELEKAHPDVLTLLLSIIEDGRLTDGQGRTVNFNNCIIIMTSNAGTSDLTNRMDESVLRQQTTYPAFEVMYNNLKRQANLFLSKEAAKPAGESKFRPELLSRLGDNIIVFHPLTANHLFDIVPIQCRRIQKEIQELFALNLHIDKKAANFLSQSSVGAKDGGRKLRLMLENNVRNPVKTMMLSRELQRDGHVYVSTEDLGGNVKRLVVHTQKPEGYQEVLY